ncbi:MAG TPA: DNA-directed RNA polymerase subunit N [Candidatus Thalassarchaeaceae archaeon]|nr:DNA-directed RNA polymerase subunit N [Candidatus Thalassarchaeaceae archaeon]
MLIPVRCWSCGKVIAHKYQEFLDAVEEGKDLGQVLHDLGFERYCCRRMFIGHIDLIDEVAPFSIERQQ